MSGAQTAVAGIPLPSDAPLFLALVAAHVAAGLVCVIAGAVAMLSRKQHGRHPQAGTVYYWSLAVVAATMAILAIARWAQDHHLFILGALSFLAATIGRTARRRAEFAAMAGTASDRLLDFADSDRDADLAQRAGSPSFGALSTERRA